MNVLIVDDHQIVRDGIILVLMKTEDIKVTGEASNGEQLLSMLQKGINPDVVIMDISLPKISGIELTEIIKKEYPATEVLIFSSHSEGENVIKSLQAGAKGILPKSTIREELIEALRTVYEGREYISKYIPYTTFTESIKKTKKRESVEEILTAREIEVLKLIAEGKSNKEIADLLFISQRTAEKHKSNILIKLEMKSVVDLVKYAIKNKIIEID